MQVPCFFFLNSPFGYGALPSCLRIVKAEKGFTNKRTQNGKLPEYSLLGSQDVCQESWARVVCLPEKGTLSQSSSLSYTILLFLPLPLVRTVIYSSLSLSWAVLEWSSLSYTTLSGALCTICLLGLERGLVGLVLNSVASYSSKSALSLPGSLCSQPKYCLTASPRLLAPFSVPRF